MPARAGTATQAEVPAELTASIRAVAYEVAGVVRSIDLPSRRATIAHGAVPGLMPAMTMEFDVHDPAGLAILRPGDDVAFRALRHARERLGGHDPKVCGRSPAGTRTRPRRRHWHTPRRQPNSSRGNRFRTLSSSIKNGQPARLGDFRGRALAITFIYTRCPLPNYCPLINRNFASAQALLSRLSAGEDWRFLSVSMDPAHDTPSALAVVCEGVRSRSPPLEFCGRARARGASTRRGSGPRVQCRPGAHKP